MMRYLLATFLSGFCLLSAIDLEKSAQDFVLETKRIQIPGYPNAFNPSIIRFQGSLLMSFRDIPDPKSSFTSYIGLTWVDENFSPVGFPQILQMRNETSIAPCRAEDARLILVGDRLFMIYSDNTELAISKAGFRVYLAEVCFKSGVFSLKNIECLNDFEGASPLRREKGWVPFVYQEELYLAYSIAPHKIFKPILGKGKCQTIVTTYPEVTWPWGEIRGGTAALEVDQQNLSFFHSSIDMKSAHSEEKLIAHYFMGAYTYSLDPPFEITAMSPEPIIGKGFYSGTTYKPYWKPVSVVFPCGFIDEGRDIWIAYGRQDHEVWVVKIDKEGLYKSLIPVSAKE